MKLHEVREIHKRTGRSYKRKEQRLWKKDHNNRIISICGMTYPLDLEDMESDDWELEPYDHKFGIGDTGRLFHTCNECHITSTLYYTVDGTKADENKRVERK